MGYDVTFHPLNRKEFSFFVDKVVANPRDYAEQVQKLHSASEEHDYVSNNLYKHWVEHIDKINKGSEFESTLGFGIAGILGYLHPYWYSRGGLLTNLALNSQVFDSFTGSIGSLASDETQAIFNKAGGFICGNYSSGCYIPFEKIEKLLKELQNPANAELVEEHIGDFNIQSLTNCLKYCVHHQLDLYECTDLYVPAAGECNTLPQNFRAGYKKNIDDFTNSGAKSVIE